MSAMTESPLVSIVMPAYNAGAMIARTIDSVIQQSYSNWELFVVDDCSTDQTREVVARFANEDQRIVLIALSKNNGAPAAPRNIGVGHANGVFVALLDADDVWHPKKLEIQVPFLLSGAAPMCCCQMKDFIRDEELEFLEPDNVGTEMITFEQQRVKGRIPNSSVLARKSILQKVPFNEMPEYKAVEDYDCWLRVLKSYGPAVKVQYPLLRYRKVAGQISGSKLTMVKRVFMVHRNFSGNNVALALVFSVTHVIGALYLRLWKKRL